MGLTTRSGGMNIKKWLLIIKNCLGFAHPSVTLSTVVTRLSYLKLLAISLAVEKASLLVKT